MNDYIEVHDNYDRGNYVRTTADSRVSFFTGVMTRVYAWMTAALLITAGVAIYTAHSPALLNLIFGNGASLLVLCVVELALVIGVTWGINRLSPAMATTLFLVYSAINGLTLASIFFAYSLGTIYQAFAASALTFGAMSLFGYTTKRDLSGLGGILFMALIGLIIATVVNLFMHSSTMNLIISYAGVLIFVGLTAYDSQKIKQMLLTADSMDEGAQKMALMGALSLYLDFINLFLYLLRILGSNRD